MRVFAVFVDAPGIEGRPNPGELVLVEMPPNCSIAPWGAAAFARLVAAASALREAITIHIDAFDRTADGAAMAALIEEVAESLDDIESGAG